MLNSPKMLRKAPVTKKSLVRTKSKDLVNPKRIDALYQRVSGHIDTARRNVQRSVDTEMVKAYWLIGREIVEEEQRGKARAEYGKSILKNLSVRLQAKYQRGFGVDTLEDTRRFYLAYPPQEKSDAMRRKLETPDFNPNLSWIHYRCLIGIQNTKIRSFYEIETLQNNWSGRELERQVSSLLFERLLKSKDKKGLMRLACKGQEISTPQDAIKEPVVLEFLGLPESPQLVESRLEAALIRHLQDFLLELGKGFAFVARQKRLTLDGDHFYADLVFYHTILKCYVIIDLKTKKLIHEDLGQMQLYVNYFDEEIRSKDDNPTLGLILCAQKNAAMVKYTLGEKAKQIFASKYQLQLPTEAELEAELKRELKELQHQFPEQK